MAPIRKMSIIDDQIIHGFYTLVSKKNKVKHAVCRVANSNGSECCTKIKAERSGKINNFGLARHLRTVHKNLYAQLLTNAQSVRGVESIIKEHSQKSASNEAPNETEPAEKRQRLDNNHRWTDRETTCLVESVVATVKGAPETFEKPTAEKFYERVMAETPKLASVDLESCVCKMRQLQESYSAAAKWMSTTGAKLLADGEDQVIAEFIKTNCPRYEHLQKIFGDAPSQQQSKVTHENEAAEPPSMAGNGHSDDNVFTMLHVTDDEEESIVEETPKPSVDSLPANQQSTTLIDNSENDSYRMLVALHEKKLQMEYEKRQHDMEMARREMAMKEKKLEMDFEIRKLQIESEERIRKHELELKLKHQNS